MNGKGVDESFILAPGEDGHFGCIGVPKQMVTEFVSQVEAAPAGIHVAVHQGHAEVLDVHIARVAAAFAQVNRECEKAHPLHRPLQVDKRPCGHAE